MSGSPEGREVEQACEKGKLPSHNDRSRGECTADDRLDLTPPSFVERRGLGDERDANRPEAPGRGAGALRGIPSIIPHDER